MRRGLTADDPHDNWFVSDIETDRRQPPAVGGIVQAAPVSGSSNFTCQTQTVCPGTVRVIAAGELDLPSVPVLEAALSAVEEHATVVILDLSRVSFMDSMGLQLIVRVEQRLSERHRTLKLVRGPSQIHRLFCLSGLEPHFRFIAPGET